MAPETATDTSRKTYDELVARMKEIALLGSCGGVLHWDQHTFMPKGGTAFRAEQLALLAKKTHEQFTDPKIGERLSELEESPIAKAEDTPEAANIRELRHEYDKATKLPPELVEEFTKVTTIAQEEWAGAREKSDFKAFLPWLEKVVDLSKRKAEAYGYEGEPYNALVDEYEPGTTVEDIEAVFIPLRKDLEVILEKVRNAPRKPDVSIVQRPYDVNLQRVFGESVAAAMGFDFTKGRLDTTVHPFCIGVGPGDTRILTRYNPDCINHALFGVMHEAGHALYEMGVDKENHFGMPMGEYSSLAVHESQSRLWENQVGRSRVFWDYFFPQAQRLFRKSLAGVSADEFYAAINDVKPSFIRVEADEGTYNLHIILRFELERALMTGEIKPADMAGEWKTRFKKYFGIEVEKDADGCLQDVHWAGGMIGYFPTYTLGNLYSAQFFAKALKDIPDLLEQFRNGRFGGLLGWLRENIHCHGKRYRAGDLCKRVTGKPLSHKPLIQYLDQKYADIYGF